MNKKNLEPPLDIVIPLTGETDFLIKLNQLMEGAYNITKQQFRNILKRSLGANKEYADKCWIYFRKSPLEYIASRSSHSQAIELIKVCIKLGQVK